MTDKLFDKELLIKYFQNDTNSSEDEKILHWLKSDPDNIIFYNEIKATWDQFGNNKEEVYSENEADWESLKNKMIVSPKNVSYKKLHITFLKYAAALLIGFALYFAYDKLPDSNQEIVANTGFNEIIVPKGEKSQIILSDGTKVWLNSGSKLRYPNSFDTDERRVFLEGEAYFDVVKQKTQKFIVKTDVLNIKVLGTKFNVKSYPEDNLIETTLVSGSVVIENDDVEEESVLLKPNQIAVFSKQEGEMAVSETEQETDEADILLNLPTRKKAIRIANVNTDNFVSWKDELLVFNNESLDKMAIKLERWFGMNIIIDNAELKNYHYRGRFEDNMTVYEVLEIIKMTTPIRYTVSKSEIRISLADEIKKQKPIYLRDN